MFESVLLDDETNSAPPLSKTIRGVKGSNHTESLSSEIQWLPPSFVEILSNTTKSGLLYPTFIAWRSGISESFIGDALIPELKTLGVDVLIPFWRKLNIIHFADNQNLPLEYLPEIRPTELFENPPIYHENISSFYSALKDSLPPGLRDFIRSRTRISLESPPYLEPDDFICKRRFGTPVSGEIKESIRNEIKKLAIEYDQVIQKDQFITMYDNKNQEIGEKILQRLICHGEIIGSWNKVIIVLVEIFGEIKEETRKTLRDLLHYGPNNNIILWLHTEINQTPRELIDQFQNHIVLLPSQSETDLLSMTQPYKELKKDRTNLNITILGGPLFNSIRSWKTIEFSHPDDTKLDLCTETTDSTQQNSVDILIITAVKDELDWIKKIERDWRPKRDSKGYIYYVRTEKEKGCKQFTIGIANAIDMGGDYSTSLATRLTNELKPQCLAMVGKCAGWRGKVFLGDIIVADRVFRYDSVKLKKYKSKEIVAQEVFHDIRTYNLRPQWIQAARDFSNDWKKTIKTKRPLTYTYQKKWLLNILYQLKSVMSEKTLNKAEMLYQLKDRKVNCPDWDEVIFQLEKEGKIKIAARDKRINLTSIGERYINELVVRHPSGIKRDPKLPKVHVAPIGTGNSVVEDQDIFQTISEHERKVLGIDMEGVSIGNVAEIEGVDCIVIKAVTDFADSEKDDHFRNYSIEGSYRFLIAFLKSNFCLKKA